MNKVIKKVCWWIFTICLITTGTISFLLLKGIEWTDPEEGWTAEELAEADS